MAGGEFDVLLKHLKRHTILAKDVEAKFLTESSKEEDRAEKKKNFFIYHFLNRTTAYCESIALLIENEFYHEAILVARTALEGLILFEYYQNQHDLADKWGLFIIYEDGKNAANQATRDAVRKWLKIYENKLGKEIAERAEEEFGFNYIPREPLRFHKSPSLSSIINNMKDKEQRQEARRLYDIIYNQFSQISHWSPSGVIGGDINVNTALKIALDAVFEMSKEADSIIQSGVC
ncbi:MAG: DUF5677 domain-containing protein [Halobacteriota archaeon]